MPYLGNNLGVAFSSYKLIDSLTASFNGTTTSFALTVNGVTPVPFPLNEQNILISVGGVPQKPDSTGTEGFRFSGSNIVFSSAPKTGEAFWGVVLAGADRVNAGVQYPDGTASVPSITFASQTTTGFYRSGSGQIGVGINGSTPVVFSTSGVQINGSTSGSVIIASPAVAGNNTLTLPTSNGSANQFLKNGATAGSLGYSSLVEDSSGRLLVGTSTARSTSTINWLSQIESTGFVGLGITTNDNSTAGAYLSLAKSRGTSVGSNTIVQNNDGLGYILFSGADGTDANSQAAFIGCEVDGTPGANDMPGRLVFSTTADGASSPTEAMRITNDGRLLVGYVSSTNTNPGVINAVGYAHKQGTSAPPGTSSINFFWTGNLQAWVDTSNVGNVTLVSDYRIKKNIQTQTSLAIPRLKQLRPVTYERANYETLFTEDGVAREGFIAHEVAAVIPSGVEGEKDAENRIQSLNIDAIVSVLTKALQEAIDKIESLEARLAAAGID